MAKKSFPHGHWNGCLSILLWWGREPPLAGGSRLFPLWWIRWWGKEVSPRSPPPSAIDDFGRIPRRKEV